MKKLFFILFIGLFIVTIKSSAQTEVIDVDDWVIISPTFPDNPANDNLFTKDFGKTPKVSSRSSVKPELTIYVESIDDYVAFKVGPKGQISNIFTSSKSKLKVENAVKAVTSRYQQKGDLADCYGDNSQEGGWFGDITAGVLCIADAIIDAL
jgi:hypothetical protein